MPYPGFLEHLFQSITSESRIVNKLFILSEPGKYSSITAADWPLGFNGNLSQDETITQRLASDIVADGEPFQRVRVIKAQNDPILAGWRCWINGQAKLARRALPWAHVGS